MATMVDGLSYDNQGDNAGLLRRTADLALAFLSGVATRPVGPRASGVHPDLPLPMDGEEPLRVIEALAAAAEPALVANNGPRYFGFVTGGSLPAALAADWLTSAWDQNACLNVTSPAAAAVEEVAARWLVELFG